MKKWYTLILIVVLLAGLSLLLYPSVSDYWNSRRQTRAIAAYNDVVAANDASRIEQLLEEARAYNRELASARQTFFLTDEELEEYKSILDVSGTGILGYIEIPKISVSLPIYHTVEDAVLAIGIGHIPGSSFPVGGESTHAVITGHTGLPSATLISDLDQLELGDTFLIRVLDQYLLYQVDQILTRLPEETDALLITEGEDYCTIVTCTPLGVNTHRLLVRGTRIEYTPENMIIFSSDAVKVDPVLVMPFIAVPILVLLFLLIMLSGRKKPKKDDTDQSQQ